MLRGLLNAVERYLGVPLLPLSVRPCPEWILSEPSIEETPYDEEFDFGPVVSLKFSVQDTRYPKVKCLLLVEQDRDEVHVRYCAHSAKASIPLDADTEVTVSDDRHLLAHFGGRLHDVGYLACDEEELAVVHHFLAKLRESSAE